MKTKAVRLYGKKDLRLEEFDLPKIKENEILAKVVSDSLCMSSYKASLQGEAHKRIPNNLKENPIIIGHEFCGTIVEVGEKWKAQYTEGENFSIQPAFNIPGSWDAPGYSYPYVGGDATYVIIPPEAMEMDCLIKYDSDVFFYGSLSEPMSCIIAAFNNAYHREQGSNTHDMGIVENGKMAILAGVGPMGLGAIDYAINNDRRPSLLVVTDIDEDRLIRAQRVYSVQKAKANGVELHYINTKEPDAEAKIMALTDNTGFDDVLVMAPVTPVVEQADRLLGANGCLNFFAGPADSSFSARINFHKIHYASTHIMGITGGNSDDMKKALDMMARGIISPTAMITHVGGLNSVAEATLNLPDIPGGKKLIYTHHDFPLTAISDFKEKGKEDDFFRQLHEITAVNDGFWCKEAEQFVMENAKSI